MDNQQAPQEASQQLPLPLQTPPLPPAETPQPEVPRHSPRKRQDGPGSDRAFAQKKAAAIEKLREMRGVPAPAQSSAPTADAKPVDEQPPTPKQPPQAETLELFAKWQAEQAKSASAEKSAADRLAAAEAKEAKLKAALENPLEFIAEVGMTEDEWRNFLSGGGKLSPEQQKLRALEKQLHEMREQSESARRDVELQSHYTQISSVLGDFPVASKAFTPPQIREHALELSRSENNRHVTWKEAVESLETRLTKQLQGYLQDDKIAAKLGLSVSKPQSELAAPNSPTTLGRNTAPSTAAVNNINPRDFAAKKARFLEMMRRQQG